VSGEPWRCQEEGAPLPPTTTLFQIKAEKRVRMDSGDLGRKEKKNIDSTVLESNKYDV